MPNQSPRLDRIFHGFADPTRRAVLERLSNGPAHVSELKQPFRMALPSFSQPLDVLES
jgi:DNA-binding transcriptional ArsR family regulator